MKIFAAASCSKPVRSVLPNRHHDRLTDRAFPKKASREGVPNISGLPSFASAQSPASFGFGNRQLGTFRLCQSIMATR